MELKVWVEGIQRIVCGVTETTTCQDVVFALAHATGKVGRFTLIERWRNNERLLAPQEFPLKILMKWGEYSNDIQFILRRSESGSNQKPPQLSGNTRSPIGNGNHNTSNPNILDSQSSPNRNKTVPSYNNNINNTSPGNPVGVVKGVQQAKIPDSESPVMKDVPPYSETWLSETSKDLPCCFTYRGIPLTQCLRYPGINKYLSHVQRVPLIQDVVFALAHATGKVGRFTLIERWRNNERLLAPQEFPLKILMKWGEYSNDIQFILRRSESGSNQKPPQLSGNTRSPIGNGNHNTSNPNILDSQSSPNRNKTVPSYNNNINNTSPGNPVGVVKGVQQAKIPDSESPVMKDVPPYREPPPPYRSPPPPSQVLRKSPNCLRNRQSHMSPVNLPEENTENRSPEAVSYNTQYRELVSLVNYQREKLSSQQVDLIKYDAEIGYWENKGREQDRQVELLQQQIGSADNQLRISTEQVQALTYVEEESELVKQNEKTLKSEIVLVRSKLANCETELLQCRNKIRKLMEEIHNEQRIINTRQQDSRQALERSMLAEMETLQNQIQQAKHATEINHLTAENLKREVGVLENAIMEKKRQVERLVQEMKEANLQSLTGSVDELRHPLDGLCKAGSARRIIGSPRQLENAAPTNKNPHGVWV